MNIERAALPNCATTMEGYSALYFLLVHADGVVSENEMRMATLMCRYENFDQSQFYKRLKAYERHSIDTLYRDCIAVLRNYSLADQARGIAWMSKIASADGVMTAKEWSLIFDIYKKELKLNQEEILKIQRLLPGG